MFIEDAKKHCNMLGASFVLAFFEFVRNKDKPKSREKAILEMEGIWKLVKGLMIEDRQGSMGVITNIELIQWFFTAGDDPNEWSKMPDEDYGYDYDRFVLNLLCDRAYSGGSNVGHALAFMMK